MPASTAAIWVLCFAAIGSAAVWFVAAVKWSNDGVLLAFEPRKPVPWGILGAFPAVLMVVSALGRAIWSRATRHEIQLDEVVQNLAISAATLFGLLVAIVIVLVAVYRASYRDFGLPNRFPQFVRDIVLGALGWLAALLPVLGIQLVSVELFRETSQNPLIKLIEERPDSQLFLAVFLSAILVAPVCEELIFRVLLQGWLERVEDDRIGFSAAESVSAEHAPPLPAGDKLGLIIALAEEQVEPISCRPRSFCGLSHGFIPIVLSSILFSLAHLGFGPDPVAIFVLALFLGYLYQRTHRILPCIVLHMLFNALTLVILWLSLPSFRT